MHTEGQGRDTLCRDLRQVTEVQQLGCTVCWTREPWDLCAGELVILPVFILFEAHESILTRATSHEADRNSNFQAILVKQNPNQNCCILCAKNPAFEGRGSDRGTSGMFHSTPWLNSQLFFTISVRSNFGE